jgi:hypothetical protein
MFPSPSLGDPLLSLSWSPPLCWGMLLLELVLVDGAAGAYPPPPLPAPAPVLVLDGALGLALDPVLEPPPQPASETAIAPAASSAGSTARIFCTRVRMEILFWSCPLFTGGCDPATGNERCSP